MKRARGRDGERAREVGRWRASGRERWGVGE